MAPTSLQHRQIAVISDVHADAHALSDALRLAEGMGCTEVVCTGDLVGYAVFPNETLELLERHDVPCVRGNYDRWTIDRRTDLGMAIDVSPSSRHFLESLPTSLVMERAGARIVLHHARPGDDMRGISADGMDASTCRGLLDLAEADVLLVGHTHVPFAIRVDDGLIANPGAWTLTRIDPLLLAETDPPGGVGSARQN